ncbi:hypothetical protein ACFE33_14630 [Falsihalocynthiibacter sp. SS001]|uniref:hypothetical protein n=1 Tax=Falsihalocynthiibacter sp. SS001 TaxID=3349698 RepID=UPI0036D3EE53
MRKLPEIATLWIGGKLSWLEQLCLVSFARAGHNVTLYSYEHIPNCPDEIEQLPADPIFGANPMLRHARTGSPAIHADMFRLHMLHQTGKIWVDADMYCYRPFDFRDPHVFGWEKPGLVCNAVLGLPQDSEALGNMLEFFKDEYAIAPWLKPWQKRELEAERDAGNPVHMTKQSWGFTGPAAVTHFLIESGEIKYAAPEAAFYPISFGKRNQMIKSRINIPEKLSNETHGVHFWARRMKPRLEEQEGGTPRKGSFMADLIERHGIDCEAAPIPKKVVPQDPRIDDPKFMAAIALEGLRADASPDSISRKHNISPSVVREAIRKLRDEAETIFAP